jgi:hypothetical protein
MGDMRAALLQTPGVLTSVRSPLLFPQLLTEKLR